MPLGGPKAINRKRTGKRKPAFPEYDVPTYGTIVRQLKVAQKEIVRLNRAVEIERLDRHAAHDERDQVRREMHTLHFELIEARATVTELRRKLAIRDGLLALTRVPPGQSDRDDSADN
jgi:septal ring factor EnvC (AmiA/AmiB activator)